MATLPFIEVENYGKPEIMDKPQLMEECVDTYL